MTYEVKIILKIKVWSLLSLLHPVIILGQKYIHTPLRIYNLSLHQRFMAARTTNNWHTIKIYIFAWAQQEPTYSFHWIYRILHYTSIPMVGNLNFDLNNQRKWPASPRRVEEMDIEDRSGFWRYFTLAFYRHISCSGPLFRLYFCHAHIQVKRKVDKSVWTIWMRWRHWTINWRLTILRLAHSVNVMIQKILWNGEWTDHRVRKFCNAVKKWGEWSNFQQEVHNHPQLIRSILGTLFHIFYIPLSVIISKYTHSWFNFAKWKNLRGYNHNRLNKKAHFAWMKVFLEWNAVIYYSRKWPSGKFLKMLFFGSFYSHIL